MKARYPATPAGELALLPTARANPAGRRPVSAVTMSGRHRNWVDALPPLLLADSTEFDNSRVIPYAYRHSYVICTAFDPLRDVGSAA